MNIEQVEPVQPRWWFQVCFFTWMFGEMIQFDEHIFHMGWFNHQLKPPTSNFYLDVMFPVGFW